MPYKTENWDALSHKQYFLTYRYLDICLWIFQRVLHFDEVLNNMFPSYLYSITTHSTNIFSADSMLTFFYWEPVH